MAAGGEGRGEVGERRAVVLDVLEDVQADDRVDRLRREVGPIGVREGKAERCDADVRPVAEPSLQLADVVRLYVGRDDPLPLDEEARLVPDPRPDLRIRFPRKRSKRAWSQAL